MSSRARRGSAGGRRLQAACVELRDERGVALPLAMLVLLILTSLAVAYATMAGIEPQISQNLTSGVRARFLAEAGIELGYNRLAGSSNWSDTLTTTGGVLVDTQPLPSKPDAREGTFRVTVRNDNQPGDAVITGVPQDPGNSDTDTNARLIMTSEGSVGGATRTITVVIGRIVLPPFPGALVFPGNEAEVTFTGNAFDVKGTDTALDGSAGSGPSVYGIGVSSALPLSNPGRNEAVVEAALSSAQKDNVTGKPQNSSQAGQGNNAIAPSPDLTPDKIASFIQAAKDSADVVLQSTLAAPVSFNNIGSTCAADVNSQTCWGTPSNPKIIYVKGDADPTSMFAALELAGNTTGTGILIVENGDLRINGNFRWNGPIIVSGNWVGVGFLGGGEQSVYGAVISNETAMDPGFKEGVLAGNAKIRYSTQALDLVRNMPKLVRIFIWREY